MPMIASYHPSAILRAAGAHARELREALSDDLRLARKLAGTPASSSIQ
jgi:uracil-DNA glycosylase